MLIDCECCVMRDTSACQDCVVTVLLAQTPLPEDQSPRVVGSGGVEPVASGDGKGGIELSDAEVAAIESLAAEGMVPPLRLVPRSA